MNEVLLQQMYAVCSRAAEALVGSAWKGAALVFCAALLLRFLPPVSAGVRTAVWTAVLAVVLCLPLLSLHGATGEGAGDGLVHAAPAWSITIVAVWLLLALPRVAQLAVSAIRLRGIGRRAVPAVPGQSIQILLKQGPRRVALSVSQEVIRPSVAGFFRPQILLPAGLLEDLSEMELKHVVLHEMEHLRRRDDWTNLLQKLGLALFPLNPALFWLDRQICREREMACDDGVLRATHARKAYAACLARLAESSMARRGLTLALGLLGVRDRQSELGARVHRILRSPNYAMGRAQVCFAAAVVTAGVLGGTVLLARSPRLISFAEFGEAGTAPAQVASSPALTREPVRSFAAPRMVAAKAVLPRSTTQLARSRPRMAHALAVNGRPANPVRQIALEQNTPAAEFQVVMTSWSEVTETPHTTLAVATGAAQVTQPTYAAVPVRGGWLLIQL